MKRISDLLRNHLKFDVTHGSTRLYWSTETASGEIENLGSLIVQSSEPHIGLTDNGPITCFIPSSTILFNFIGIGAEMVELFNFKTKALWTLEMPSGITYMFDAYTSEIVQSCLSDGIKTEVKLVTVGEVRYFFDHATTPPANATDVFSRKYLRATGKQYGQILRKAIADAERALLSSQIDVAEDDDSDFSFPE